MIEIGTFRWNAEHKRLFTESAEDRPAHTQWDRFFACRTALTENPDADYFKVTLFGSLAKTGEGLQDGLCNRKNI